MKKIFPLIILSLFFNSAIAQVGVNNTNPQAQLDVSASSVTSPSNEDGILIPRIDNFPVTNPTATQDGMMVFATGNGTPTKGFYYWDNGTTSWISLLGSSSNDSDWYTQYSTNAPNSITDNIFTEGNVSINDGFLILNSPTDTSGGLYSYKTINTNTAFTYRLIQNSITSNGSTGSYLTQNSYTGTGSGGNTAITNLFNGTGTSSNTGLRNSFNNDNSTSEIGINNNFISTSSNQKIGVLNNLNSAAQNGTVYGFRNLIEGGTGTIYGTYTNITNGSAYQYGSYINLSGGTGPNYGLYSSVDNVTNGFAAYLVGRTSLGETTSNRYLMPAADGTAGQIMTTDGSGNISFTTPSTGGTLDQSYDFGGAGAGKNITADTGTVRVDGNDGFLVTGTFGSGSSIDSEITGAGTRMFFNPNKAAFRAGEISASQWDDVNIGNNSIAFGYDTQASGNYSIAFGNNTQAPSFSETTIGINNTSYTPISTNSWSGTDRLFSIGNGTSTSTLSNALTIYKDGRMNINDAYTMPNSDGTIGQVLTTNGAGTVVWANSSSDDGDWTIFGNNVFKNTGNVGIGWSNTAYPLTINDDSYFNSIFIDKDNNGTSGGRAINSDFRYTGSGAGYIIGHYNRVEKISSSTSTGSVFGEYNYSYNYYNGASLSDCYGSYNNAVKSGGTNGASYGVYANGYNESGNSAYGVYGVANNLYGNISYGIYGYATGGATTIYAGFFNGNVYSTGTYLPSARQLKTNIKDLSLSSLEKLNQLKIKSYQYNTNKFDFMNLPKGNQVGVIAEEMETIFPELIKKTIQPEADENLVKEGIERPHNEVEFKAVNYTGLVPHLVKAVQELNEEVNTLKEENIKLKEALKKQEQLEQRLEALELSLNRE